MDLDLARALRIQADSCITFVGAGGKSTAIFQAAREYAKPILVTTTTHLHINQVQLADSHHFIDSLEDLEIVLKEPRGITLITGPHIGDRASGLSGILLNRLHALSRELGIPLLIEGDGSRQLPLKAPAAHEPVIPDFTGAVVVTVGLAGLHKAMTGEHVHRPEIFSVLSGLSPGEKITTRALVQCLTHPAGGLKSIPPNARRIVLMNRAFATISIKQAEKLAESMLAAYHSAIIASLHPAGSGQTSTNKILAIRESTAIIILAAGGSKRMGAPKQLLPWRGKSLVRRAAETALAAGSIPVLVIVGSNAEAVAAALQDLPVSIVENPAWQDGQSTSIRVGLSASKPQVSAVLFMLSDQPHVTPQLLRKLIDRHNMDLSPVVAPSVDGIRTTPVLFDRVTFPALMALVGDVGGRAIFPIFPPVTIPWSDPKLLMDVDTLADLSKLT